MECQICYEILETTTNLCITECRHQFCSQCIFTWIRKSQSCPICRKDLLPCNNVRTEISPIQSPLSALTQQQNNFIQFLKENVISQNFMSIHLLYKKLLQDSLYFHRTTNSNWRHDVKNICCRNKNIISKMNVDNLQYTCKDELNYDNHPSTIFERLIVVENCETEIKKFHEIFLECLYLYNLKNNNKNIDFLNILSEHGKLIYE